jgi:hypothetical protein
MNTKVTISVQFSKNSQSQLVLSMADASQIPPSKNMADDDLNINFKNINKKIKY